MKEIFKQVLHGKAHIHIGNAGITQAVIKQIENQFRTKKIIKLKFLNISNSFEMNEKVTEISELVRAKILDIRGRTCILERERI